MDFCNARQTVILTLVQMHINFLPRQALLSDSSTSGKLLDLREKEKSEGNIHEK